MGIRVTRKNLVPLSSLGPYFLCGLWFFILATLLLFLGREHLAAGSYRHPWVLGTVHACVLGWGVTVALGALQQMVPVVFGSELHSTALARWGGIALITGVTALIGGMLTLNPLLLATGGLLIPMAVYTILFNVWRSQAPEGSDAATRIRPFVRSAGFYLALTVIFGAGLAIHLSTGWLQGAWLNVFTAHVVGGLIGWFVMLVSGISYHLLPFFGLTEKKQEPRFDIPVLVLLHLGIGLLWLGSLPSLDEVRTAGVCSLIGGVLLFLWDTRTLFRKRPVIRMNPTVTYVRIAHLYGGLVCLGAVWFLMAAHGPVQVVWLGVAGLAGWLSNAILGYLHRIMPFFVWHNKYWDRSGEPGVPSFRNMVHEGAAWLGLALYNAGVIGLLIALPTGLAVTGYAALILCGAVAGSLNLLRTLWL